MDPEIKKVLEKQEKLLKENNKILHKMRRGQVAGKVFRILKILFFVALALGSFYFLQPYVQNIQNAYGVLFGGEKDDNNSQSPLDILQNLDPKELEQVIEQVKTN